MPLLISFAFQFIHQGITFLVTEVSHDSKVARLVRADVNYTTKPRDFTNIDALQTQRIREVRASTQTAFFGREYGKQQLGCQLIYILGVGLLTIIYGMWKLTASHLTDQLSARVLQGSHMRPSQHHLLIDITDERRPDLGEYFYGDSAV